MQKNTEKPVVIACIPAYNEEKYIAKVIVETKRHVDKIIVCDDGSTDLTSEIARELGAIVIRHERNMGYGAALRTLFKKALEYDPDIIVTLDADGQHDPKEIPRLIEPIINGEADIVIGSRFLGKTYQSRWRVLGVKAVTRAVKTALNVNGITDSQSGFRAYRANVIKHIIPEDHTMAASIEVLAKAKEKELKIREVPVTITTHDEASKQDPLTHFAILIAKTIQYVAEKHPLLLIGLPGVIITSISLLSLFTTILHSNSIVEIYNTDVRLLILLIILLVMGLSMISLGIILYAVARLKQYIETKI